MLMGKFQVPMITSSGYNKINYSGEYDDVHIHYRMSNDNSKTWAKTSKKISLDYRTRNTTSFFFFADWYRPTFFLSFSA